MSATLKAEYRKKLGTRESRRLRRDGLIPANVQGGGGEHVDLSIVADEFWAARRGHEHLFDLELGDRTETAVVRQLQWDLMGEGISHIEFRRVQRGVEIESEVELVFLGHAKGGVVNKLMATLIIKAIPSKIPDSVEVNVDGLEPGTTVTAGELAMPEGVSLGVEPEAPVVVISVPKAESDEPATEEETPEDGAAPPAEPESTDS